MQSKLIISDTSCFIVLSNIGQSELLRFLYKKIVTTTEIAHEFGENLPDWVEVIPVSEKNKRDRFSHFC